MSNSFAFEFLAGKYEGGVYLIPDDQELMIGRGAELDIVLVEDMVSRRHATLTTHGQRLVLQDLHSTNGTFVNGERIEQCELEAQDRVLIGTSILKVTAAEHIDALLKTHPELALDEAPERHDHGSLADLGVINLLRLVAGKRRTGLLNLTAGSERIEVVFVDGVITHAGNPDLPTLPPLAALAQAMGFAAGAYQFVEPAEGFERPTSFAGNNDETLAAASEEHGRVAAQLRSDWPAAGRLLLVQPQPGPWSAAHFAAQELDALQLACSFERIGDAMAHAPAGPLALIASLGTLCERGYLRKDLTTLG